MDSVYCNTKTRNIQSPPFSNHRVLPQGHRFYYDCLRESWCQWIHWGINVLSDEDVWFVSKTFKREVTKGKALRLNHKWLNRLTQAYSIQYGHRIRWIRSMAMQKREVIHFHLLICARDLGLLSRKRWEHRWQSMDWNNGTCRIYESDKSVGQARYLVREISKEGDISWGGDWRGLNTPGAVGCCNLKIAI